MGVSAGVAHVRERGPAQRGGMDADARDGMAGWALRQERPPFRNDSTDAADRRNTTAGGVVGAGSFDQGTGGRPGIVGAGR